MGEKKRKGEISSCGEKSLFYFGRGGGVRRVEEGEKVFQLGVPREFQRKGRSRPADEGRYRGGERGRIRCARKKKKQELREKRNEGERYAWFRGEGENPEGRKKFIVFREKKMEGESNKKEKKGPAAMLGGEIKEKGEKKSGSGRNLEKRNMVSGGKEGSKKENNRAGAKKKKAIIKVKRRKKGRSYYFPRRECVVSRKRCFLGRAHTVIILEDWKRRERGRVQKRGMLGEKGFGGNGGSPPSIKLRKKTIDLGQEGGAKVKKGARHGVSLSQRKGC